MKLPIPVSAFFRMRDSNDPNHEWIEPSKVFDLHACGRAGCASIKVRVNGYWSDDPITLRVERRIDWTLGAEDRVGTWRCELSHSSGGRLTHDDKKHYQHPSYVHLADDLEAEACFGSALIAASRFGLEILAHTDTLEAAYQERKAEDREAARVAKEVKQALIDNDPPIGDVRAARMIDELAINLGMCKEVHVELYERGSERRLGLLSIARGARLNYYWCGRRVAKGVAIKGLSRMSDRSTVVDK